MAVVTLDRVTKRYGSHLAVDNVSLEVGQGEIMGLLGPNGSGKTTILRILTGYLRPSAGAARVAGFDIVRDGRAARGRVGYVPEDAPLYPQMRVNEFLAFMGRLRGLGGEKLRGRLALARERLALQDMGDTIIGRLSRGYRQRVALAQAVLHQPDLLVLDEPTNGLDPRQIIEFRGLIRGVAEHCAVVITSHILGEIERIADRVAILLEGRLLAVKSLEAPGAVRVRARADMAPRLSAVLRSMSGLAEVVEEAPVGNTITWRVRLAGSGRVDVLVAALSDAGVGVVEIAEIGSDLERTFLALTSGKTPPS
jgi:ABC-2 type transport system ATP-binding protein